MFHVKHISGQFTVTSYRLTVKKQKSEAKELIEKLRSISKMFHRCIFIEKTGNWKPETVNCF